MHIVKRHGAKPDRPAQLPADDRNRADWLTLSAGGSLPSGSTALHFAVISDVAGAPNRAMARRSPPMLSRRPCARVDLYTRIRMPHRNRSQECMRNGSAGCAPPTSCALTNRDTALRVTGSGVGLALTGNRIVGLVLQRANPNAWLHLRRVLPRCAAHGRASPSTLLRGTEQTGSQAGCIPRLPNAEQSPSVRHDLT